MLAGSRTGGGSVVSASDNRFDRTMNASDAVLWDIEKDPILRSTITAVGLFDKAPDWERLVERFRVASSLIPRLTERVVVPPMRIGPPRWVPDADFDLTYHLRRARVPEPGDLRAVLDLTQPIAMESFDRARPLWEFTLVEGLEGGQAALVQKLHHSLTDGVGGIELAMMLLDDTPSPAGPAAAPSPAALVERPTPLSVLSESALDQARSMLSTVGRAPGALARAAVTGLVDPLGTAARNVEMARSIARLLTPVAEPASPLLRGRSLSRRFDTLEVGLGDLKAAGHAVGGTLNDAFMAAVVGGLAEYHRRHQSPLHELRVTMPINVRHEGDEMGGNRFAPARFPVPADIADPVERMGAIGERCRSWQHEPALGLTEVLAATLDRLPVSVTTSIFGGMLKNVDLVCTNVPGLPSRSYLAGAEVLRQYAFAPTSGSSLSVALLSHIDMACVGLVVDTAAVPDHELLVECLVFGFDEVLALAGHHAVRTA
jgi:diacylglycerol O-acyltransferase / wax synthase